MLCLLIGLGETTSPSWCYPTNMRSSLGCSWPLGPAEAQANFLRGIGVQGTPHLLAHPCLSTPMWSWILPMFNGRYPGLVTSLACSHAQKAHLQAGGGVLHSNQDEPPVAWSERSLVREVVFQPHTYLR